MGGAFPSLLLCVTSASGIVIGVGVATTWVTWRDFLAVWMKQEVITASDSMWQIERLLGPWKRVYYYTPHNISQIHRAGHSQAKTWEGAIAAVLEVMTGLQSRSGLVFRYKHIRVNFAQAATEAEAHQVMEALHRRFPGLCQPIAEAIVLPTQQSQPPWLIEWDAGQLTIRIPPRRRGTMLMLWAAFMLPTAGIGLCCYGLLLAAFDYDSASQYASIAWVLVNTLIVLPFLLAALRELLWLIRGIEVITMMPTGIALAYERLVLSRKRAFSGDHISGLRCELGHAVASSFPTFLRWPGATGALCFNYGPKTYRFGQGLKPAEANALVRQILDRFPQYGRDDMIPKVFDHTSA